MYSVIVSSVLFASLGLAAPAPTPGVADEKWFQPRDTMVSALFEKRQANPSDPSTYGPLHELYSGILLEDMS